MYFDGINLADGSVVSNLTVQYGGTLPNSGQNIGELYYVDGTGADQQGLYLYNGSTWQDLASDAEVKALEQVAYIIKTADSAVPNAVVLAGNGAGFVKTANDGSISVEGAISLAGGEVVGILPASHLPALSGDVSSSAGSSIVTLANTGVTAGTYNKVTVDAKGRVTNGTNPTTVSGYGITDVYTKSDIDTLIIDGGTF